MLLVCNHLAIPQPKDEGRHGIKGHQQTGPYFGKVWLPSQHLFTTKRRGVRALGCYCLHFRARNEKTGTIRK